MIRVYKGSLILGYPPIFDSYYNFDTSQVGSYTMHSPIIDAIIQY